MKRTVIIVRHAHAENHSPDGSDKQRPLSERGKEQARAMGEKWKTAYPLPDLLVYSDARRTVQTLKALSSALVLGEQQLLPKERLYYAQPEDLDDILFGLPEDIRTVALLGHNMTLTDYINQKIEDFKIDTLPVMGIVAFSLDLETWSDNDLPRKGHLLFWDHPNKS